MSADVLCVQCNIVGNQYFKYLAETREGGAYYYNIIYLESARDSMISVQVALSSILPGIAI